MSQHAFAHITIGKIIKVYPEANMADVVLLNGDLLPQVQIMSSSASSRTGVVDIPVPDYQKSVSEDPIKLQLPCNSNESDVFAVVAFLESNPNKPIILGYLFPEECEVLCGTKQEGNSDGSMYLWKHRSNVYTRVGDDGDIEISHPSGTLIKIGKNTERSEILNYDREVRPFKSKKDQTEAPAPSPWITIKHPSGTYIVIDADGNLYENVIGSLQRTVQGDVTEVVMGNYTRTVTGISSEVTTGPASRESVQSISDKAPIISHN